MIRLILIGLLFLVSCKTTESTGSLNIQSEIDTTIARIGDVISLSIAANNINDKIVVFPDIEETESMEIRDKSIISQNVNPYQVEFKIVFWDTGGFVIPEYSVEILNADSTKDLTITSDSINIKIISMIVGSEDTTLKLIKDPVPIKMPINWRRWLLALLLFLLLAILYGLWRRRLRRESLEIDNIVEFPSAKEIALAQLNNLNKLIDSDDKSFYLKVSFILREFIENKFYVKALEMTTGEIDDYKEEYNFKDSEYNKLFELLKRADLAKFAKQKFTKTNRESDFNWIKDFITNI